MMAKTQINKLIKMMNDLDYPFEAPLKESFIESIIQIEFNSNSRKFLVRNLAVQAMEKLTTELHSLSEMDRRHVVSILAEIANGYDDFNDMLIYLEFYPNHKILIS